MSSCCGGGRGDLPAPAVAVAGRREAPGGTGAPPWHREAVALDGGRFLMGTDDADGFPQDAEGPVRPVVVEPFAVDRYTVTNARFAGFVADTGHVTEAERFGWSYVFAGFLPAVLRRVSPRPQQTPWWCGVSGADWRHPDGPGSDLEDRWDHPVVHVSWNDAAAFCAWAGGRLPSEAEWEYAARGGLEQRRYPWGDELTPGGEHHCNIWQGHFPTRNTADDGHRGTAPVDAYAPNGYGLYNCAGNVWEWCADPWAAGQETRVMRGGSYMCHDSYCNRYRVAARTRNTPDSSGGNIGFRMVPRGTAATSATPHPRMLDQIDNPKVRSAHLAPAVPSTNPANVFGQRTSRAWLGGDGLGMSG
ncbi:formylglycine-generating enzyme required for sulfatase activity [Streptosporangium album]|uniref:Formylglycine-generating enzyme required for sulfatase activity n=1 Tax=Streptosporangium album TaxID=47479 RepID=A0A7W7RYK9_9ACTN|nr:formylglycine-generating enzyme family protein [Streptosporangium album]MBB4939968.1 formylglycine-generating enzyme required for sulfatase activity [Streptosporangium album]